MSKRLKKLKGKLRQVLKKYQTTFFCQRY